jgi:hypothetical protein
MAAYTQATTQPCVLLAGTAHSSHFSVIFLLPTVSNEDSLSVPWGSKGGGRPSELGRTQKGRSVSASASRQLPLGK